MKSNVISLDNKKAGSIELDDSVFGADVRVDLMARYVNWQLAKRRDLASAVKGRSDVAATRAKPFKQKGTGRARQGSSVVSQMRGGGITFGPVVRSFAMSLPKKVRKAALRSALSSKQADGKLVIIEDAALKDHKTKSLVAKLEKLGWESALFIDGETVDNNISRAAGNIIGFDILPSQGANVYDILRRDTLVITKSGVEKLVERLK
jgi:large subunit ribosomal protein L4